MSAALAFRCAQCGLCCRTIRVPLTDADLFRLEVGARLPLSEIVEWLAPEEIDMTGEPESFVRLPEGRRLMVLRHGGAGCRFLADERCSVHPFRPTSCAAFPFFVEGNAVETLAAPCEPVRTPVLAEIAPLSFRLAQELGLYAARVGVWNRRQRTRLRLRRRPEGSERFFAFLRRSFGSADGMLSGHSPSAPGR